MYLDYSFPEISIELDVDLKSAEKNVLKILKKAEKSKESTNIIDAQIALCTIYKRMNSLQKLEECINSLQSMESKQLTEDDQARVLLITTIFQLERNEKAKALANLKTIQQLVEKSKDHRLVCKVKESFGVYYAKEDDYTKAEKYIKASEGYAEKTADAMFIGRNKYLLGVLYFEKENLEASISKLTESITIYEQENAILDIFKAKRLISKVYLRNNDVANASKYVNEVVEESKKMKGNQFQHELALGYLGVGEIYVSENKMMRSEQIIADAQKILTSINDIKGLTESYILQSKVFMARNRVYEAEKLIQKVIELKEEQGVKFEAAELYEQIGFSMYETPEREKGKKYIDLAEKEFKNSEDKTKYPAYLIRKGHLFFKRKELKEALKTYEEAETIFVEQKEKRYEAYVLKQKAKLFITQSKLDLAGKELLKALNNYQELKQDKDIGLTLRDLADLNYADKKIKQSIKYLQESTPYFEKLDLKKDTLINQCKMVRFYRELEENEKAEELFSSIAQTAVSIDYSSLEELVVDSFLFYGNQLVESSNFVEARDFLNRSMQIYAKYNNKLGLANSNIRMAMTYYPELIMDEITKFIDQALLQLEPLDVSFEYGKMFIDAAEYGTLKEMDKRKVADYQFQAAEIFIKFEKIPEALQQLSLSIGNYFVDKQFLKVEKSGDRIIEIEKMSSNIEVRTQAHLLVGMAILQYDKPELKKVFLMLNSALSGFDEMNDIPMIAKTHSFLAEAHMLNMKFDEAVRAYELAVNNYEQTDKHGEGIEIYSKLVDIHFATRKFTQSSIYLERQIDVIRRVPSEQKDNLLAIAYNKLLAVSIALNNYDNAIVLINRQLAKERLDEITIIRLKCEQICLYFLEGDFSGCIKVYESLPKSYRFGSMWMREELINPHYFYSQLSDLYSSSFTFIGRLSAVFHFVGDAFYKEKRFSDSKQNYEKAMAFIKEESSVDPSTYANLHMLLKGKAEGAKSTNQATWSSRVSVSGKIEHLCFRCGGKGRYTIASGRGAGSHSCRLCEGTGRFTLKPPFKARW